MISDYPKAHHVPLLRALWKEAFGDTEQFLDGFFAHGFDYLRCRCIFHEDVPVSVLYWFEVTYRSRRFAYLYAVATAGSHRGQGLFSALLEDTKQVLSAAGFDGILLVPETESLARMYGKLGFSPCGGVDVCTVEAAESAIFLRETGPEEFRSLRRKYLPEGSAEPGEDMLAFLASQYRFWTGAGFLATGQVYDGCLVCQEYLGDMDAAGGLVRALGAAQGRLRSPGMSRDLVYFLPLRPACAVPDYFPFALD